MSRNQVGVFVAAILMTAIAIGSLLVITGHASPIYTSTGEVTLPTCPQPAFSCSAVHGTGSASTIDGNAAGITNIQVDLFTLGSGGSAPCATSGYVWLKFQPSGGVVFDDEFATIATVGTGTCPTAVTITGTESGMPYEMHLTSPHPGPYGQTEFDYSLFRGCCPLPPGGGSQAGDDPPIRR